MKTNILRLTTVMLLCTLAVGCSEDETITPPSPIPSNKNVFGFYVLNEGGWKQNNANLDFYAKTGQVYQNNIFSAVNPDVVLGLGDTGNDLQAYGAKLYAVMNGSDLVEIMDKTSAKHIKAVNIAGPRNITFHEGYAYVTAYSSPTSTEVGSVSKIDTTSLEIVATCNVGRQPETLVVFDGKLYVTNSGGYMNPSYEKHISVIDLNTFTETEKINIADNINRIACDNNGNLYIGAAGDYSTITPALYVYNIASESITDTLNVAATQLWLDEENLYILGTDYITDKQTLACYNIKTKELNENPLAEHVKNSFTSPYSIAVDPTSKEILICDAKDFVSLGKIYCLSSDGKNILWEQTTGIMPGHIVFVDK